MYISGKKELTKHPKFHQAIVLCKYAKMSWRSIYMDPDNELAIQFNGKLSIKQIKLVLRHFLDLIAGEYTEEINPQEHVDYSYNWDGNSWYTQVFTPDGWDFKAFTMPSKVYTEEEEKAFKEYEEMLTRIQAQEANGDYSINPDDYDYPLSEQVFEREIQGEWDN